MNKTKGVQFAILACWAALPLLAADQAYVKRGNPELHGRAWVERAQFGSPVREGARLILRADQGSVVVKTGAGNQVEGVVVLKAYTGNEAQARRVLGSYELSTRVAEGGGLYVEAQSKGGPRHNSICSVNFEVTVPQRFNLDVETQGGDISVENPLLGEAHLTTAGGDIHASDISGLARLETAGGNITLGKMGNRVEARTSGGNIRTGDINGDALLETSGGQIVTGQVNGTLRSETAGGDVVVGGATGQVTAQTAGGQIQIGPVSGGVRAETAGGSIRLQGARGRVVADTAGGSIDLLQLAGAVKASTAAGRILAEWVGANAPAFRSSELESSMGDVFVYLPVDFRVTIDAAIDVAAGHQIVCDFPLTIQGGREDFTPQTIRGHGAVNGGGEVLRIRTVSGNIEIHKLDAKSMEELKNREDATWRKWQERQQQTERRQQEKEQRRRQQQQDRDDEE